VSPNRLPAQLDAIFSALADPTRRGDFAMLAKTDIGAVTDVAEPFRRFALARFSKHLSVLRTPALMRKEKPRPTKWWKLEPAALQTPCRLDAAFGHTSLSS